MFSRSPPPPPLLDFIDSHEAFFIAGHKEPDADAVGSQLALASLLRRLGKQAVLCSAGPFNRYEIIPFENQFLTQDVEIAQEIERQKRNGHRTAAIIVDCSSTDRIGDIEKSFASLPLAVIDHHKPGKVQTQIHYIDSEAPACVVLIFFLFEVLKLTLSCEDADALFLGLCADTGFFRHLDSSGAVTFELAAELVRMGANPKKTFAAINGGKSLESRQLLAAILSRAQAFFEGKLIISWEELDERQRYGLESRDSDTLYQLLLSIKGVEAIALIRQETEKKCVVGLRSLDNVDVAAVAAEFGGGGHKNAAGFPHEASIKQLKQALLGKFEKIFV
jgi:phosphoesterase RecJ-like protein